MKSYILDIIPKIQKFSKRLDEFAFLLNQHWVLFDDTLNETKTVFIFRENNELIISNNGIIEKSKWEFIGNDSLIIETKNYSHLLKHGFLDEGVLVLKRDSHKDFSVFINESKAKVEFNSIESITKFLQNKYLTPLIANGQNIEDSKSIAHRDDLEKIRIASMLSYLKKGEIITKHSVSNKIEVMTRVEFDIWNKQYGEGMLIQIAIKEQ